MPELKFCLLRFCFLNSHFAGSIFSCGIFAKKKMRVWYGLSLFWSNAGLNVLYLRGIFAIRSCLPWVGFRKTQVFLVQMWIFGWDVHFCKIRNISLFPLKAVCYVAHWQASFPLLVLLLHSPLCSSNLTVFASLCPSACWFDISFTCFEHNAGCCFLICPTREEADKAVNAYHNKRTLPGVREHSNRALLACLSLHLL